MTAAQVLSLAVRRRPRRSPALVLPVVHFQQLHQVPVRGVHDACACDRPCDFHGHCEECGGRVYGEPGGQP